VAQIAAVFGSYSLEKNLHYTIFGRRDKKQISMFNPASFYIGDNICI